MKIGHLGNGKTQSKTVYSTKDASPTLTACMGEKGNTMPYIVVRGGRMKVLGHLLDSSNQRYVVYDKEQDAPTLQAAMGTGGGNVPYITDRGGGQRIVAMRGRDPQNPSDRTSGNQNLEQRLEANSEGICNTLTTVQKDNMVLDEEMGIRKLTPRESWRLMDFSDEDFDKAKYKTEVFYLEGGQDKCNVKLKAVCEKQRLKDTETYVLCTTNNIQDMEILKTICNQSAQTQEEERIVNVSIATEKWEEPVPGECATNIIRCGEIMGMHFTMMQGKDQHRMVIIASVKKDNMNTEKCMKIITESNLSLNNVYIILILLKRIIESKIFTVSTAKANIQGYIKITEDSEKNFLMHLSNLRMEIINERVSNTALYKQAGNSIVQNVLVAVMGQLFEGKENIYKERSENGTRPTASEPICVNSKSGRGGAKDYSLPCKTECIAQTDAQQQ